MLSRRFIPFLLVIKMAASQTVYPTTAVSYSTNAVPTVQTYPASSATVTAVPTTVTATAVPVSVTATAMPATAIPATVIPSTNAVVATAKPSCTSTSPTVTLTQSLVSPTVPATVVASPISSAALSSKPIVTTMPSVPIGTKDSTEAKAYFLPANIPDPKVTILSNDLPKIIEAKPRIFLDEAGYAEIKTTDSARRDSGPMTAVKRITMACTDDAFLSNKEPLCPGIPKIDINPVRKDLKSNPIDFEGLLDSFMTCL